MEQARLATEPVTPTDGMTIREDTRFAPGTYFLPAGLTIDADDVTLDGNGAMLVGNDRTADGIRLADRRNVRIRNIRLREYRHGIRVVSSRNIHIDDNQIKSTREVESNTDFLNIWCRAEQSYGGAILLDRVEHAEITGNDLQHQMCGLLSYHCNRLTVRDNLANYNSGFGFHLYNTCDSVFESNWADFCCRYEPRGPGFGHMGADAAGFLIVHGSCRNQFRGNFARMGGDGFFLAGMTPEREKRPCDDNVFENNDASLSPNIAFEATFSSGNIFRGNKAERCNYGFWLGFSRDILLENNRCVMNRQAGVAAENACGFTLRGNSFQRNGCGVLLWSRIVEDFRESFPERRTCHRWTIDKNVFTRNDKGVHIATDRDHGIRPLPPEQSGRPESRPHDISITHNDIQENRVGIELFGTDRIVIEGNTLHRNVECNTRLEDDAETTCQNNLGAAGGYL